MTILINKLFVENKIAEQIKEAKEFLANSSNVLEYKKERIEDMFLSSADIADEIERMIKDGEAKLDVELDIVLVQHMRADALVDVISEIE